MMKIYRIALFLGVFAFFCVGRLGAQRVSLKSNALEWVLTTPNLGAEFALGERWSLGLSLSVAPWKLTEEYYAKQFRFQPELRYWFRQNQVGLYAGVTAYYASFDLGLKTKAYYGDAACGGLTCGYNWLLSRRWNLEVSAGVGVARVRYAGYAPGTLHGEPDCSRILPAPTALNVSFIYVLR